jgi:hypothetical protein
MGAKRDLDPGVALAVGPRVAAEMLGGCGRKRVYALIDDGELESYLDGTARRITVKSIKNLIARKVAEERERREALAARRRENDDD